MTPRLLFPSHGYSEVIPGDLIPPLLPACQQTVYGWRFWRKAKRADKLLSQPSAARIQEQRERHSV